MPRGAYTAKQDRKADHIEKSYEKRGVSKKEAESRAWATVNKQDKGGKNSGTRPFTAAAAPPPRKANVRRVLPTAEGRMSVISPLAQRHLVDDGAGEFVVDVDDDGFVGLLATALAIAEEDAGAADRPARSLRGVMSRSGPRVVVPRGRRPRNCRCRRPASAGSRHCPRPRARAARG